MRSFSNCEELQSQPIYFIFILSLFYFKHLLSISLCAFSDRALRFWLLHKILTPTNTLILHGGQLKHSSVLCSQSNTKLTDCKYLGWWRSFCIIARIASMQLNEHNMIIFHVTLHGLSFNGRNSVIHGGSWKQHAGCLQSKAAAG